MKVFFAFVIFAVLDSAWSQCEDVSDVTLTLVRGQNLKELDSVQVPWSDLDKLLKNSDYNNNKATFVYAHGFTESFNFPSVQTMIKAYMTRRDEFNIFIVDWGKYASGNYFLQALPNALKIGTHIGNKIVEMSNLGFNIDKFHFVGHSLGAQLFGQVGRTAKASTTKLELTRITGLDPAGPAFFPISPFLVPLGSSDAKFVDIIHTDSFAFGGNVATGHADFWPNAATLQPGCPPLDFVNVLNISNLCSHLRSWQFYAESVVIRETSKMFIAAKCDNWTDFTDGKCLANDPPFIMGLSASPTMRGNFYLRTNDKFCFSLGADGAKYEAI